MPRMIFRILTLHALVILWFVGFNGVNGIQGLGVGMGLLPARGNQYERYSDLLYFLGCIWILAAAFPGSNYNFAQDARKRGAGIFLTVLAACFSLTFVIPLSVISYLDKLNGEGYACLFLVITVLGPTLALLAGTGFGSRRSSLTVRSCVGVCLVLIYGAFGVLDIELVEIKTLVWPFIGIANIAATVVVSACLYFVVTTPSNGASSATALV
ncbi:MAG: hypothetical protein K1X53_14925 [Candidatus Sumerlaeaceae bacterium]|nr:hypothetical protein [Candidatus Sumerlaeaceae bacterium]